MIDARIEREALEVARGAMAAQFLKWGLEFVHTMPAGGDRSAQHDRATEQVRRLSDADPVIAAMIEERTA